MGIRPVHFAIVALLMPASARASGHNFDVSAAASLIGAKAKNAESVAFVHSGSLAAAGDDGDDTTVFGWHFIVGRTFHKNKFWGIAADVSGHFLEGGGDEHRPTIQQITFMLGPRWETPTSWGKGKGRIMLHALPLGFRLDNQGSSSTAIVAALGGTIEYKIHSTPSGLGFAFTYDYLVVKSSADQNRFSLGLTRRFID